MTIQKMQDTQHQSQSQTVALGSMRGISLIEFFKNSLLGMLVHAASGIRYRDFDPVCVRGLPQGNASPLGRKLYRIGQQIVPYQFQQGFVCGNDCAILQIRLKLDVLLFHPVIKLCDALTKLLAKIIGNCRGDNGLLFQLVQLEHIGNEIGKPPGRLHDGGSIFTAFALTEILLLQQHRIILNPGQGCFELVRHIGKEICFQRLYAAQLRHHLVEVLDHAVKVILVLRCVHRRYID